jgi:hypothetical protein
MKKTKKKLVLAKETVLNLSERSFVVGGSAVSCITACDTCYCSGSCHWTCQCASNEDACWEPQTRNNNCSW